MTTPTSEPETVRVTRYRCPHCGRTLTKRAGMRAHIARCWHNPQVRACRTCVHFREAIDEPDVGYHVPEQCDAEMLIPAGGRGLVIHCPRWEPGVGIPEPTTPAPDRDFECGGCRDHGDAEGCDTCGRTWEPTLLPSHPTHPLWLKETP